MRGRLQEENAVLLNSQPTQIYCQVMLSEDVFDGNRLCAVLCEEVAKGMSASLSMVLLLLLNIYFY